MNHRKQVILMFLFVIAIFIFIFLQDRALDVPDDSIELKKWFKIDEGKIERKTAVELPFHTFIDGIKILTFTHRIDSSKLTKMANPYLIVGIFGQAFRLRINDLTIEEIGDMEKGKSEIGYNPFLIRIPPEILKDGQLNFELQIYSMYEVGIRYAFILPREKALFFYHINRFSTNEISTLSLGFSIGLSILFIILGASFKNRGYLDFGIASIFLIFSFLGMMTIEDSPIPVVLLRKIVYLSLYLLFIHLYMGYKRIFGESRFTKFTRNLIIFYMLPIIFNMIFIWNMKSLVVFHLMYIILIMFGSMELALWISKRFQKNILMTMAYILILSFSVHDVMMKFFEVLSIDYTRCVLSGLGLSIGFMIMGISLARDFIKSEHERERARMKMEELYEKAIRDGLTNVYNRSVINEMNGMVDKNYSIMFLDVDNLKQINDNYGHDVGDKVLIEVANVIKKNVRKSDLVMRYGGDEFVVVMWDCDLKSAKRTAEKLLTEIGNIRINDQVKISVSIGLSKGMDSLEKSIMMADRCMLEAKKLGKNGIKSDFQ